MLFKWCADNGKAVKMLPRTKGVSTTWLKDTIKDL